MTRLGTAAATVLVLLSGCGSGSDDRSSPPPVEPAVAKLPPSCDEVRPRASQTAVFVARGSAWAATPSGARVTCLFPVADPGLFLWGPRGDRALLARLEVRGLPGTPSWPLRDPSASRASWGRPTGKAIVFVSGNRRSLLKSHPDRTTPEDVTPVRDARYFEVAYHPSGLAFAFVLRKAGEQGIWISSNRGERPRRLVRSAEHTSFGPLAFALDGHGLLFAAGHADGRTEVHRIEFEAPTSAPVVWRGRPGLSVSSIWPRRGTADVALTVGSSCADHAAVFVDGDHPAGRRLLPGVDRPNRVVGWLDRGRLLVAAGRCGERLDLWTVSVARRRATPLVFGVEAAATRAAEPMPPPPFPLPLEGELGSGFA